MKKTRGALWGKIPFGAVKKRCGRIAALLERPVFEPLCILVLMLAAAGDFALSGVSRRTITFYAEDSGKPLVEERFIAWQESREAAVALFIDEITLGPSLANTLPLLGRGTRLETFFLRDGAATVEFSEEAALPPGTAASPSGEVAKNLRVVYDDIKRNFDYVKEIRFFIAGREVPLDTREAVSAITISKIGSVKG
jgi:hypothetical protein